MPGPTPSIRTLFVLAICLLWLPVAALAQQEAPVTLEVVFAGGEFGEDGEVGGPGVGTSSASASSRTATLVFETLTQPQVQTRLEKQTEVKREPRPEEVKPDEVEPEEAEPEVRLRPQPLTVGGFASYERVDFDNQGTLDLDGNIYSTNLQLIWDVADFSLGFVIPYDYLDLDSVNAHRIGTIAFGQYHLPVSAVALLDLSINGNYTHTAIDKGGLDDVNTFGAGASVSLTLDQDTFLVGGTMSYQFNADDSDRANDQQHLLKVGATGGVRLGTKAAVTLFGVWTYDATDYDETFGDVDDNYFDLGLELAWSLSPTWRLSGGYKTTQGLDDFASHMVFMGTFLRF